MTSYTVIDFESRSWCELKRTGAWVYSQHPTTEIICLGYQHEGQQPQLWLPSQSMPESLRAAILRGDRMVAHNVIFERACWENIMVPLYGWPPVPPEQWFDTMATCAMKGIPLALERAAHALGLPQQKGSTPKKFFKPDRKGEYPTEGINVVYDYNLQDCRTQTNLLIRTGRLPDDEMANWHLNQRMQARGILLDLDFIRSAQITVDRATVPLLAEFKNITGLEKTGSPKLITWVKDKGVKLDNLKAETIDELLGVEDEDDTLGNYTDNYPDELLPVELPPDVRRALEIRRVLGSASVKKLRAMLACIGSDGRARGATQYHAASTGREGGRLFQPQNFPRGKIAVKYEMEALINAIHAQDPDRLSALFQTDAISAVATALRHAIIAAPGHVLNVGDYSTIEARIVLALAGQWDKIAIIEGGRDIYNDMGAQIYGRPIDRKGKDKTEGQVSKGAVLGLGFQCGDENFQRKFCPDQELEFCSKVVGVYRKEWAPEVPKLWRALEDAALRCVWERRPYEAYGIEYRLEEDWLTCRLPSGRKLWYFDPRPIRKEMKWSTPEKLDIRRSWTYRARKNGKLKTVDVYGGHLTENVVQATARDLLYHSLHLCEREELPPILTVHDEAVTEVPENSRQADPKMLQQIMEDRPRWAIERKIPVAAETWAGARYRK